MKISRRYLTYVLSALTAFCLGMLSATAESERPANRMILLAAEIPGGFLKTEKGKGIGVYPDLFYEAAAAAEVDVTFRFVPWGRAFQRVESSDFLMTFPLTRLPEREGRYRWLVPLQQDQIVFVSIDKPINSLNEARKLKRILVWRGSSMEIFLKKQRFENLVPVGTTSSLIRMLQFGRGDAWFTVRPENDELVTTGDRSVKFVSGAVINTESVWLVGGKSFTHNDASRRFAASVASLAKRGRLKDLKSKYGLSK